jgi:hypothetical protein
MSQTTTPSFETLKEIKGFLRCDGEFSPVRLTELSHSGAYIKTALPARIGAVVELRLEVSGREILAMAVVCRVEHGIGMGVEFTFISEEDAVVLDRLVRQIELSHTLWVSRTSRLNPHNLSTATSQIIPAEVPTPRNRPIERRSRMRHKFAATVALAEADSGRPIKAQITELGRGGCFVKLDTPFPIGSILQVSITENSQIVRARAIVASVQPGQGMGLGFAALDPRDNLLLEEWLESCVERHWLASNRRKSQRVVVNLPVRVIAKNGVGTEISEDTTTVSVSAHGALLQLEMKVVKGQKIVLQNPNTSDALECSIDYLGGSEEGRREVGVSFLLHNRTLWQISFPMEFAPRHTRSKN